MKPYYEDSSCTIYHGDAIELSAAGNDAAVMLTDPPYGIAYTTNARRKFGNPRSIYGDEDTLYRKRVLLDWGNERPALVFGSHKADPPGPVRATLVWDQMGALGMGDLSIPWKPSFQMIYVLGGPWAGSRDCGAVLQFAPVQSLARFHPHEKPLPLLSALLAKCIEGPVFDPFMGSGSTLVAAKARGRSAIGIEIEERYCEIAAKRLAQEVLDFGSAS